MLYCRMTNYELLCWLVETRSRDGCMVISEVSRKWK